MKSIRAFVHSSAVVSVTLAADLCDLCEKCRISGENRDHSRGGRYLLGMLLGYERSKVAGCLGKCVFPWLLMPW